MKKKFKYISFILFTFLLAGCQDVKKGFSGKNLDKGEEFLVIKKNPLEMPPDFNELPKPNNAIINSRNNDKEENNFKELIDKGSGDIDGKSNLESVDNQNIEESILDKIK